MKMKGKIMHDHDERSIKPLVKSKQPKKIKALNNIWWLKKKPVSMVLIWSIRFVSRFFLIDEEINHWDTLLCSEVTSFFYQYFFSFLTTYSRMKISGFAGLKTFQHSPILTWFIIFGMCEKTWHKRSDCSFINVGIRSRESVCCDVAEP